MCPVHAKRFEVFSDVLSDRSNHGAEGASLGLEDLIILN